MEEVVTKKDDFLNKFFLTEEFIQVEFTCEYLPINAGIFSTFHKLEVSGLIKIY